MSDRHDSPVVRRLALGGLLVATALAYANSFSKAFVFDDTPCIIENVTLRSWESTFWPSEWELPGGLVRRSVVRYSLALNYALGGLDPWGYHLVNLLIHLAAGWLLFDLVRRTLLLARMPDWLRREAFPIALAATALWLLHPLQSESVTYIVQRLEAAMGMFYLGCLYAVLRGSQSTRPWPWYVAAVAACWLGMGSKEVMVTAPVVVALYDRVFLSDSWKSLFKARGWVYLGFLPAILWMFFQVLTTSNTFAVERDVSEWNHFTRWEYLRSQPRSILHYFRLVVWPTGQCLDYGWRAVAPAEAMLPGLAVVALLGGSLVALRRWPAVGFLGVSFFVILSITSGLKPLGMMAVEHRMYLPLAAVTTLLVAGSFRVAMPPTATDSSIRLRRRWLLGFWLAAAVALGATTFTRNEVYSSGIAMWEDVVAKSPDNPRGQANLGEVLVHAGEYERSIEHSRRALELQGDLAKAHNNLGLALFKLGRFDEAIPCYHRALELEPYMPEAHLNLGNMFRRTDPDRAMACFRNALRIQPNYSEAHNNLGAMLAQSQPRLAAEHYQRALQLNPENADAHCNLGNLLARQGRLEEALTHYRLALRIDPQSATARKNLAVVAPMLERQRNRAP